MRVHDAEPKTSSMVPARVAVPHSNLLRAIGVTAVALAAANCSQQTSKIDPKYGVSASPRVVADGQPVPKGGGRQMVGQPYTVAGKTYVPTENPRYVSEGLASWYGSNFHGRLTANGEIFDRYSIAAAHTTMPLPSYARVTNLENNHSIIVRVNDRGPYHGNRVIDVSQRTAEALDFKHKGTARVRVEYVGRASPNGSDDRTLLASLRTDGQPAALTGQPATMIARAEPRASLTRNAIAIPNYEPEEADEPANEAAQQPARPGQTVAGVPLPPERPFDLGTIPYAATPVRPTASLPGVTGPAARPAARPVVASLAGAPQAAPGAFQKPGAFEPSLQRPKFVSRSAQN